MLTGGLRGVQLGNCKKDRDFSVCIESTRGEREQMLKKQQEANSSKTLTRNFARNDRGKSSNRLLERFNISTCVSEAGEKSFKKFLERSISFNCPVFP